VIKSDQINFSCLHLLSSLGINIVEDTIKFVKISVFVVELKKRTAIGIIRDMEESFSAFIAKTIGKHMQLRAVLLVGIYNLLDALLICIVKDIDTIAFEYGSVRESPAPSPSTYMCQ
jgi:hypothetical protein